MSYITYNILNIFSQIQNLKTQLDLEIPILFFCTKYIYIYIL